MKSQKKVLGIIWGIITISVGLAGGYIASVLLGGTTIAFWTGLGFGSLLGFMIYPVIIFEIYDLFDKEFPLSIRSSKEEKDD